MIIVRKIIAASLLLASLFLVGCPEKASVVYKDQMQDVTDEEYVIAKKPVDRHYIGAAWSTQHGPIEDPTITNLPVKKDRSFSDVKENFARRAGFGLGAQVVGAPLQGQATIEGGSAKRTNLGGLEIFSPYSLADIPFEPDINYITESLYLANFKVDKENMRKAGISASASAAMGTATASADLGTMAEAGKAGEGLVVAYKLQTIDKTTYVKSDSGKQKLELNKPTYFANNTIRVTAKFQFIEAGANKRFPATLEWSCQKASAKKTVQTTTSAWLIEIKPTDPKRKSKTIAFPAHPKIEDCNAYSAVLYKRIDPRTNKIHRQKIDIVLMDAEVADGMPQPKVWDAIITVIDESFNIKNVKPSDL